MCCTDKFREKEENKKNTKKNNRKLEEKEHTTYHLMTKISRKKFTIQPGILSLKFFINILIVNPYIFFLLGSNISSILDSWEILPMKYQDWLNIGFTLEIQECCFYIYFKIDNIINKMLKCFLSILQPYWPKMNAPVLRQYPMSILVER